MADYTLYYTVTPNNRKISLMLEELDLSYKLKKVDIRAGDQFRDDFVKINPNSKTPALVDHTHPGGDLVIFESGAILEYLADKHQRFLPSTVNIVARMQVKQWLYWQMAGFGPMLGQVGYFWKYAKEDVAVGKERYMKEALRLFQVLDRRLGEVPYVGGKEYSIADMACFWWSRIGEYYGVQDKFEGFENVERWQARVAEREAVQRVYAKEATLNEG